MIKTKYVTSDETEFDKEEHAIYHEKNTSIPERTLKFYGHSDDCKEIEGTKKGEPDEFYLGHVEVIGPTGLGFQVFMKHVNPGVWMIGLAPLEEDADCPVWPLSWSIEGYSMVLEMEVPTGTRVYQKGGDEDGE